MSNSEPSELRKKTLNLLQLISDMQNTNIKNTSAENKSSTINQSVSYIKKKIPKALKNKLWIKFHNKKFEASCYVCDRYLYRDDFHAAHIHPESQGGETSLDNLIPTCRQCNLKMGTQNLLAYKQKVYGDPLTQIEKLKAEMEAWEDFSDDELEDMIKPVKIPTVQDKYIEQILNKLIQVNMGNVNVTTSHVDYKITSLICLLSHHDYSINIHINN